MCFSQDENKAWLYGISTSITIAFGRKMEFISTGKYFYGRSRHYNGPTTPPDHIQPVHGKGGIRYKHSKIQAGVYAWYNGWKRIKDYNPTGEDNLQYTGG